MSILLYSTINNDTKERILRTITKLFEKDVIEICQSTAALSCRLKQPHGKLELVITLVENQNKLTNLLLMHNLFINIPIILLLPGNDKEMVTIAHKLYPRYIGYIDDPPEALIEVLKKMINRLNNV